MKISTAETASRAPMSGARLIVGFLPVIAFTLLLGRVSVGWAAAIAAAVAIFAIVFDIRGGIKVIPCVAGVVLATIAVISVNSGDAVNSLLVQYGRGLVTTTLAAYVLITVAIYPFTLQFSRTSVPREVWHSPTFIALNRRISAVWGCALLFAGLCNIAISSVSTELSGVRGPGTLLLQWGPTALAVFVAFKYTKRAIASGSSRPGTEGTE
jgi:hypothetical protein